MSKEANNEEGPQGADGSKKDADLYENRGTKKIVRLVTVVAYMFSVSFVAIVLSAYYLFLWEPPNPNLIKRPVHLSSEPEVQFLLGDSPDSQNDAPMNDFLSEMTTEHKGSNSSYKPFTGRIIGDTNNLVDSRYDGRKHRRTLNESLALLKNSLIEFMRNRMNNSKLDGNLLGKEKRLISTKRSEEKTISKNVKNETGFEKMMNRTLGNSGTFLTLNSSTISRDEVNNDRFTSTRNGSVYKNVLGLNGGSTENTIGPPEQNKRNISNSPEAKFTTGTDGKSGQIENHRAENSSESLYNVETFSNSNEEFLSTNRTTMFDKSNVIATIQKKDPEIQGNRDDQLVNDRSDSSKNVKHLRNGRQDRLKN